MTALQNDGWEHPFCRATVTFAIDLLATTDTETLQAQATFVKKVTKQLAGECQRSSHLIIRDSTSVRCVPTHAEFNHLEQLEILPSSGPARPGLILQHDKSIDNLRRSTVWFLLMGGDIAPEERHSFTRKLLEAQLHGTTLVTVRFGQTNWRPAESGFELAECLHALCPNYLSLFYDKKQHEIRVMHSKGVLETMLAGETCPEIDEAAAWEAFPTFRYEQLNMLAVPAPMALAADEVLLGDGFTSFHLTDLLTGNIDPTVLKLLVVDGNIDMAKFKPVGALAQAKSGSDELAAWVSNEFWDYDDFRLRPRVDRNDMAKSAFLALRMAVSEGRDQDHVDRLREVLRQANHHNLVNFNNLCRNIAKLRGEVIVSLLSQPSTPHLKIGGPPGWVENIQHFDNIVPANMGWHSLFWNGEFVADNKRPVVARCTICGKANNPRSVLLLTRAASSPVDESATNSKSSANVEMPPDWLWEVGYATENDVLCRDMCCCDACSVLCLSHGFAGLREKPAAIWPIARFDENEVPYQAHLKQVFGSRFQSAHASMAILSVLIKAWKDIKTQESGSRSNVTSGGSHFAQAVSQAICYLLEGIRTDLRGVPVQLSAQDVVSDAAHTEEKPNADLASSSLEPDDKPVLGKVYTGHVSIVWKNDVFVTLQGIDGNPNGRIDMGEEDDALHPSTGLSQGKEVRVKVIKADSDAIELSLKKVNQTMTPMSASRQTTDLLSLGDQLRDAIRQIDGRRYRADCLLDRVSLRAFALAFEAACIAIGEDIISPLWARGLRVAVLKRYLFCLLEGTWADGLDNQKELRDNLNWIRRLITQTIKRPESFLRVVLEEGLLPQGNVDIIRGLSVFDQIEGVLWKATVAFCQGLTGMELDAQEATPNSQWTVVTVFDMVLQSPEITQFWEEFEQENVIGKKNDSVEPQPAVQRSDLAQVETTSPKQAQTKDTHLDLNQMEAPEASASSSGRTTPQRRAGWGYVSGKQRGLAHSIHAGGSTRQTSQQPHIRDGGRRMTMAYDLVGDHDRGDGDVAQRAYDFANRNFPSVLDSHALILGAQVGVDPREARMDRQPQTQESRGRYGLGAAHSRIFSDAAASAERTENPEVVEIGPSEEQVSQPEQDSSGMGGAPAAEAWW